MDFARVSPSCSGVTTTGVVDEQIVHEILIVIVYTECDPTRGRCYKDGGRTREHRFFFSFFMHPSMRYDTGPRNAGRSRHLRA